MDGVIENTSTDKIIMIDKLCKRILESWKSLLKKQKIYL